MMVPLAISPAAIRLSTEARGRREIDRIHRELTELVYSHGLIAFGCEEAKQEFLEAVRELGRSSTVAAQYWDAVLTHLGANRRLVDADPTPGCDVGAVATIDELREAWSGRTRVAVMHDEKAEALGLDPNDWSFFDFRSMIEIGRHDLGWNCRTVRDFRSESERGVVVAGTNRDYIWDWYLEPLVLASKRISVFDRFAAKNIVMRHRNGRADRYPVTALGWLLQQIDSVDRTGIEISIFTGLQGVGAETLRAVDVEAAIRGVWGGRPGAAAIASIAVHAASWEDDRGLPHDRHIRFDVAAVVQLPAGIDRFDRESLNRDIAIDYRWVAEPVAKAIDAERQVMDASSASQFTVRD
jgi:hypothetical protein